MSILSPLKIGTRASRLARWQAEWVAKSLEAVAAGRRIEIIEITTTGDRVTNLQLSQLGTTGVFTKEIQRALLDGQADVAVHSLKDLPTETPSDLLLAAVPPRAAPRDVLICREGGGLADLKPSARVATGSLRRRAQLLHLRSDLEMCDVRGNVETRLAKLDQGEFDALVLAEAGLTRLGLGDRITEVLDIDRMLPAAGQGALGIECRTDDAETCALLGQINHPETERAVRAERAVLAALRAGCHAPVGVYGYLESDHLLLRAAVLSVDGKTRLEASLSGPPEEAESLGQRVAADLLSQGAGPLIDQA